MLGRRSWREYQLRYWLGGLKALLAVPRSASSAIKTTFSSIVAVYITFAARRYRNSMHTGIRSAGAENHHYSVRQCGSKWYFMLKPVAGAI